MRSALRKTPKFVPWTPAVNACPMHPHCEMRKVLVLGREFWECPHPDHITGELEPVAKQPSGGLLISPIRARAARRVDEWREIAPPVYQLPPPQSTGPMQPVKPDTGELPSMDRPAWAEELLRDAREETPCLTAEPAQPANFLTGKQSTDAIRRLTDLANGIDDETIEVPAIRRRHVRESEKTA